MQGEPEQKVPPFGMSSQQWVKPPVPQLGGQVPPQLSLTENSRHSLGQEGLQHAPVSKVQDEVQLSVPPWKPLVLQVWLLRLLPSHCSPVSIVPSPQQRPLWQVPAQLAAQLPPHPSPTGVAWQVAGHMGVQQALLKQT
jgi:hypothetical protein